MDNTNMEQEDKTHQSWLVFPECQSDGPTLSLSLTFLHQMTHEESCKTPEHMLTASLESTIPGTAQNNAFWNKCYRYGPWYMIFQSRITTINHMMVVLRRIQNKKLSCCCDSWSYRVQIRSPHTSARTLQSALGSVGTRISGHSERHCADWRPYKRRYNLHLKVRMYSTVKGEFFGCTKQVLAMCPFRQYTSQYASTVIVLTIEPWLFIRLWGINVTYLPGIKSSQSNLLNK